MHTIKYSVILKKSIKQTKQGRSCSFLHNAKFFAYPSSPHFFGFLLFPSSSSYVCRIYTLRYTLLVFLNTQIAIILIKIIEFSLWHVIRQLLATSFSDDCLIDRRLLRISASTHLPLAKSTPKRETVLFVFAQKQTFRRVNYIKRG